MIQKNKLFACIFSLFAILSFSLQASAAESKGPAKKGDEVTLEYTGTLEDGTVFDASEKHGKPLSFTLGDGRILPKFEEAVTGMKVGEKKTFTLKPADAYGEYDAKLTKLIPRDRLPAKPDPKVGMMLGVDLTNGRKAQAIIKKVSAEGVLIDLNPPLAGKTLTFQINIVGITSK
ncbi:MAG: FKBP-type peptidyl-prolyl cis-trans isomerase [Nitrospinales bacterium]